MKRIDAIREIMDDVYPNEIVIASNGMVSRDLYAVKDRPLNFYMVGAMGSALAVGIGVAATTDKRVHVITGDGAFAMGFNTTLVGLPLNLTLHVLVNGVHATTGGQDCVPMEVMLGERCHIWVISKEKGDSPRIPITLKQQVKRFKSAINK